MTNLQKTVYEKLSEKAHTIEYMYALIRNYMDDVIIEMDVMNEKAAEAQHADTGLT
jgi:hypothetical protein